MQRVTMLRLLAAARWMEREAERMSVPARRERLLADASTLRGMVQTRTLDVRRVANIANVQGVPTLRRWAYIGASQESVAMANLDAYRRGLTFMHFSLTTQR